MSEGGKQDEPILTVRWTKDIKEAGYPCVIQKTQEMKYRETPITYAQWWDVCRVSQCNNKFRFYIYQMLI